MYALLHTHTRPRRQRDALRSLDCISMYLVQSPEHVMRAGNYVYINNDSLGNDSRALHHYKFPHEYSIQAQASLVAIWDAPYVWQSLLSSLSPALICRFAVVSRVTEKSGSTNACGIREIGKATSYKVLSDTRKFVQINVFVRRNACTDYSFSPSTPATPSTQRSWHEQIKLNEWLQ